MKKAIAIAGTLDTKGEEIDYLRSLLSKRGHPVIIADTGVLGIPSFKADISRREIAISGGADINDLRKKEDEAFAQKIMASGLQKIIIPLAESNKIHGLLAIGGGQGSTIVAPTLKALRIGFPKLLVSTKLTQAGARPYAGSKDVLLMPSVADLAGINCLTRLVLTNAAGAISGMVEMEKPETLDKPVVIMSMNGTVTDCGLSVKAMLEKDGFEVLNELMGGLASAGPHRLEAAGNCGIPQIVVPGSADFINFLGPETVPNKYRLRNIYSHNPQATLVRTNAEDNELLGKTIAKKLNKSRGPVAVLWPTKGLSTLDLEGKPYWDPDADAALYRALIANFNEKITFIKVDAHINSSTLADRVIKALDDLVHN
jgi:uncharacterized protein (UPF0261 family)